MRRTASIRADVAVPIHSVGSFLVFASQSEPFPCYLVRRGEDGKVAARVEAITQDQLPDGDVLIRVAYSSLNYKDALACQGHPGVVRTFPHVPGIDCAGVVVESASTSFRPGDEVLVTGYELGAGHWGGFAAYVRVPADWIVQAPRRLVAARRDDLRHRRLHRRAMRHRDRRARHQRPTAAR